MNEEIFGHGLRRLRDSAELSLDDIARITRIPKPSLEHLEAGRFEALPGEVFVRGFLRSYAQCLGVNSEALIEDYLLCAAKTTSGNKTSGVSRSSSFRTVPSEAPRTSAKPSNSPSGARELAVLPKRRFVAPTWGERKPLARQAILAVGCLLAVAWAALALVLRSPQVPTQKAPAQDLEPAVQSVRSVSDR